MLQQLLITLGAGIASAVFFFLPVKGSAIALALGVVAPLPLLIVGLGYGLRSGLIAAACGAVLILSVLHYLLALAFILSIACPALILAGVALRAPASDPANAPSAYPVGQMLMWATGLTIVIDWFAIIAIGMAYPSFDAAVDDLATRFAPAVTAIFERANAAPSGFNAMEMASLLVLAMAPVMAVWGVFALALNNWLAGRVVQISGRLTRPWQDIPQALAMPRWTPPALAVACALSLAPGVVRVFAMTAAAALAAALALQGLAVLHQLTRGHAARTGLLMALYLATLVIFPWPLLLVAGVGLVDLVHPLRNRRANPPVST